MANMIRISPNALRAAAERHLTVTAAVDEATARLANLVTELNAAWDGGASNDALDNMREIREDIADIAKGTSGHADRLKRIAEAFEALDESSGNPTIMPLNLVGRIASLIPIGPDGILRPFNWFLHNSLRIVPDEVRNVANQCRHVSDELMETAMKLTADVDALSSDWEGRSYERFAADSRDMITAFKNCASRLVKLAETLNNAADRYEALDNSLA